MERDERGCGRGRERRRRRENSEREHEVIEKAVVRRRDDRDLKRRENSERRESEISVSKHAEHEHELDRERRACREDVEPVRELVRPPADPRRERTVLVVVIHRGEIAPARIAARDLRDARLEVDTEALPQEDEAHGARRRLRLAPAGSQPARREDERGGGRFDEHPFGLVRREILRSGHERDETNSADDDARARRDVRDEERRRREPDRRERDEPVIVRRDPQERRDRRPLPAIRVRQLPHRQDSLIADEAEDLERERIEDGEMKNPKRA